MNQLFYNIAYAVLWTLFSHNPEIIFEGDSAQQILS